MGKSLKLKPNALLRDIYYDPKSPGSLGGQRTLLLQSKKQKYNGSHRDVAEWLSGQDTYTLHKPTSRHFTRRKTIVSGLSDQYQADIIEMSDFHRENNGSKYILTVIDVFSKFAWAFPLKTKSGKEVRQALQRVLKAKPCQKIQTDRGKEFYNRDVKELLKKYSIEHFSSNNEDIKASVVERWNRTLKTKLYRWFTASNETKWVKVLPDIVKAYNNSVHRATGVAPAEVNHDNEEEIWHRLYTKPAFTQSKKPILSVGDNVRISKHKMIFDKGYTKNWSSEVFQISHILQTHPTTYRLIDDTNTPILGTFYAQELQKVKKQKSYLIDKVIKMKKVGKQTKYFVKWKGFGSKYNSWVNEEDVIG